MSERTGEASIACFEPDQLPTPPVALLGADDTSIATASDRETPSTPHTDNTPSSAPPPPSSKPPTAITNATHQGLYADYIRLEIPWEKYPRAAPPRHSIALLPSKLALVTLPELLIRIDTDTSSSPFPGFDSKLAPSILQRRRERARRGIDAFVAGLSRLPVYKVMLHDRSVAGMIALQKRMERTELGRTSALPEWNSESGSFGSTAAKLPFLQELQPGDALLLASEQSPTAYRTSAAFFTVSSLRTRTTSLEATEPALSARLRIAADHLEHLPELAHRRDLRNPLGELLSWTEMLSEVNPNGNSKGASSHTIGLTRHNNGPGFLVYPAVLVIFPSAWGAQTFAKETLFKAFLARTEDIQHRQGVLIGIIMDALLLPEEAKATRLLHHVYGTPTAGSWTNPYTSTTQVNITHVSPTATSSVQSSLGADFSTTHPDSKDCAAKHTVAIGMNLLPEGAHYGAMHAHEEGVYARMRPGDNGLFVFQGVSCHQGSEFRNPVAPAAASTPPSAPSLRRPAFTLLPPFSPAHDYSLGRVQGINYPYAMGNTFSPPVALNARTLLLDPHLAHGGPRNLPLLADLPPPAAVGGDLELALLVARATVRAEFLDFHMDRVRRLFGPPPSDPRDPRACRALLLRTLAQGIADRAQRRYDHRRWSDAVLAVLSELGFTEEDPDSEVQRALAAVLEEGNPLADDGHEAFGLGRSVTNREREEILQEAWEVVSIHRDAVLEKRSFAEIARMRDGHGGKYAETRGWRKEGAAVQNDEGGWEDHLVPDPSRFRRALYEPWEWREYEAELAAQADEAKQFAAKLEVRAAALSRWAGSSVWKAEPRCSLTPDESSVVISPTSTPSAPSPPAPPPPTLTLVDRRFRLLTPAPAFSSTPPPRPKPTPPSSASMTPPSSKSTSTTATTPEAPPAAGGNLPSAPHPQAPHAGASAVPDQPGQCARDERAVPAGAGASTGQVSSELASGVVPLEGEEGSPAGSSRGSGAPAKPVPKVPKIRAPKFHDCEIRNKTGDVLHRTHARSATSSSTISSHCGRNLSTLLPSLPPPPAAELLAAVAAGAPLSSQNPAPTSSVTALIEVASRFGTSLRRATSLTSPLATAGRIADALDLANLAAVGLDLRSRLAPAASVAANALATRARSSPSSLSAFESTLVGHLSRTPSSPPTLLALPPAPGSSPAAPTSYLLPPSGAAVEPTQPSFTSALIDLLLDVLVLPSAVSPSKSPALQALSPAAASALAQSTAAAVSAQHELLFLASTILNMFGHSLVFLLPTVVQAVQHPSRFLRDTFRLRKAFAYADQPSWTLAVKDVAGSNGVAGILSGLGDKLALAVPAAVYERLTAAPGARTEEPYPRWVSVSKQSAGGSTGGRGRTSSKRSAGEADHAPQGSGGKQPRKATKKGRSAPLEEQHHGAAEGDGSNDQRSPPPTRPQPSPLFAWNRATHLSSAEQLATASFPTTLDLSLLALPPSPASSPFVHLRTAHEGPSAVENSIHSAECDAAVDQYEERHPSVAASASTRRPQVYRNCDKAKRQEHNAREFGFARSAEWLNVYILANLCVLDIVTVTAADFEEELEVFDLFMGLVERLRNEPDKFFLFRDRTPARCLTIPHLLNSSLSTAHKLLIVTLGRGVLAGSTPFVYRVFADLSAFPASMCDFHLLLTSDGLKPRLPTLTHRGEIGHPEVYGQFTHITLNWAPHYYHSSPVLAEFLSSTPPPALPSTRQTRNSSRRQAANDAPPPTDPAVSSPAVTPTFARTLFLLQTLHLPPDGPPKLHATREAARSIVPDLVHLAISDAKAKEVSDSVVDPSQPAGGWVQDAWCGNHAYPVGGGPAFPQPTSPPPFRPSLHRPLPPSIVRGTAPPTSAEYCQRVMTIGRGGYRGLVELGFLERFGVHAWANYLQTLRGRFEDGGLRREVLEQSFASQRETKEEALQTLVEKSAAAFRRHAQSEPTRQTMEVEVTALIRCQPRESDLTFAERNSKDASRELQHAKSSVSFAKKKVQDLTNAADVAKAKIDHGLKVVDTDCTMAEAPLVEAEDEHTQIQHDILAPEPMLKFYDMIRVKAKQNQLCVRCDRSLSPDESPDLERYVKACKDRAPAKLRGMKAEVQGWEKQNASLKKLIPLEITYTKTVQDELPVAEAAAAQQEEKPAPASRSGSRPRTCQGCIGGGLDVEQEVAKLESELSATGSPATTEEIQEQLSELSEKLRASKELDKRLANAIAPIRQKENELATIRSDFTHDETTASRQLQAYNKSAEQLDQNKHEIPSYETRGGDNKLHKCERELKQHDVVITDPKQCIAALQQQISQIDQTLADSKAVLRNFQDNLRLRAERKALQTLDAEIEHLDEESARKAYRNFETDYNEQRRK
ncbi:hypothetical protein JCM6882_009671 [Rhodosporidiobolus microsporus]